jgi:hypothetical protein
MKWPGCLEKGFLAVFLKDNVGLMVKDNEKYMGGLHKAASTANCELLAGCIFFKNNMNNMTKVIETMKKMYCLWNYKQCARYRVASALSRNEDPKDLFPGDTIRAKIFIAQHYHLPY